MAPHTIFSVSLSIFLIFGHAAERPVDAFAAVRYRHHWFATDDHDMPSKRLFTFLMFLFTLVETGGKEGAPIVTIPAQ